MSNRLLLLYYFHHENILSLFKKYLSGFRRLRFSLPFLSQGNQTKKEIYWICLVRIWSFKVELPFKIRSQGSQFFYWHYNASGILLNDFSKYVLYVIGGSIPSFKFLSIALKNTCVLDWKWMFRKYQNGFQRILRKIADFFL